jgi:hypothetical protein
MSAISRNRRFAQEIMEHVHRVVLFSANYPSRSESLQSKTSEVYEQQLQAIKLTTSIMRDDYTGKDVIAQAAKLATKFHCGNCYEMAAVGYQYAVDKTDQVIDIVEIHGGDHVFIVIGRKKNIAICDYPHWGPDAFICDPWASLCYPAKKLKLRLKNYCGTKKMGTGKIQTITESLNHWRHKLALVHTNSPKNTPWQCNITPYELVLAGITGIVVGGIIGYLLNFYIHQL